MPKLRKEVEDKILDLIEQEYTNIEIAEKTGIHRKTVAKRRKQHIKRKQEQEEKSEPEQEEIIPQEQPESHPLEQQIYTLMRSQRTNSREEALSQAIETQHSFNPYLLNHGLKTPTELMTFFEDTIKKRDEEIEEISASNYRYLDRLIKIRVKSMLE